MDEEHTTAQDAFGAPSPARRRARDVEARRRGAFASAWQLVARDDAWFDRHPFAYSAVAILFGAAVITAITGWHGLPALGAVLIGAAFTHVGTLLGRAWRRDRREGG
jgi:hypothetical protein